MDSFLDSTSSLLYILIPTVVAMLVPSSFLIWVALESVIPPTFLIVGVILTSIFWILSLVILYKVVKQNKIKNGAKSILSDLQKVLLEIGFLLIIKKIIASLHTS